MPKKKRPDEMTTREAVDHLFPKPLRDALEEALADVADPTPDSPEPRPKKPTGER